MYAPEKGERKKKQKTNIVYSKHSMHFNVLKGTLLASTTFVLG